MDATTELLSRIAEALPEERSALRHLKRRVAAESGTPLIRNDALLARYRQEVGAGVRQPSARLESILRLNAIRSESGIATVTVITHPFPCPGRCVYCPTDARAPKSYLADEPAVRRAIRSDYDPFGQVWNRLEALWQTGHPTDKIDLILKGGTWSFYPHGYQRWFIRRCFEAANAWAGVAGSAAPATAPEAGSDPDETPLRAAQDVNETAACRLIGITIETRPDYVNAAEVRLLRELGVTRVELGVQTLEDAVLEQMIRDHGTAAVRHATRLLKDAGIKVAYHLMPNLPGATPESDIESARLLFADPGFRPDTMKLYPCVVVEGAELYDWWKQGRYTPYDDETLLEVLAAIKRLAPPYLRFERVIRDIPSTSIAAGCKLTNLREAVQGRMRARGERCRCVRCRQVRGTAAGDFQMVRRTYSASEGIEEFLSFEDSAQDRLAALLRLRIPPAIPIEGLPPELSGAALVRELHAYGLHLPLHHRGADAAQHQGLGRRLLAEAERLAFEVYGFKRLAVIAGIGVREYYAALGYRREGTYMVKQLTA